MDLSKIFGSQFPEDKNKGEEDLIKKILEQDNPTGIVGQVPQSETLSLGDDTGDLIKEIGALIENPNKLRELLGKTGQLTKHSGHNVSKLSSTINWEEPKIQTLSHYIQSASFQKTASQIHAGLLQNQINSEIDPDSEFKEAHLNFRELTPNIFKKLYQKGNKNFAIFYPDGMNGIAHIARAAQILKTENQDSINIIIVPSLTQGNAELQVRNGQQELVISKGCLIDQNGQIYYGKLDTPIKADFAEYAGIDQDFRSSLENANLQLLTTSKAHEECNDKVKSKEIIKKAGSNIPAGFSINSKQLEEVEEKLINLFSKHGSPQELSLVMKPSRMYAGEGVKMLKNINIQNAKKELQIITQEYGDVIVEPWVESQPLYLKNHPHFDNNQRLDWNIRVTATQSGASGMIARVGPLGVPINEDQGAIRMNLEEVYENLQVNAVDNLPSFKEFQQMIKSETSKIMKETKAPYIGLDFIFDGKKLVCLELNAGLIGGVKEEAKSYEKANDQITLKNAKVFVKNLSKEFSALTPISPIAPNSREDVIQFPPKNLFSLLSTLQYVIQTLEPNQPDSEKEILDGISFILDQCEEDSNKNALLAAKFKSTQKLLSGAKMIASNRKIGQVSVEEASKNVDWTQANAADQLLKNLGVNLDLDNDLFGDDF